MFQNLRPNSPIYILHKESSPYIDIGTIVSVTQPVSKYPMMNYMQQQETVVDIVVKINGNDITLQKLPANSDVADQGINGNLVIATSREAMNQEINSLKEKSTNIINSIDYHNKIIQDCDKLLQTLNPEFAEQQQQKQEINMLKLQLNEILEGFKEIKEKLINKE